jgi:hypothetical protein
MIGSHASRVLDRRDSEKAHGLAVTHRESLSRFDTSRLEGSGPLHWTHQRASLDSCGAIEVTPANPSRGSHGNTHFFGNVFSRERKSLPLTYRFSVLVMRSRTSEQIVTSYA